MQVLHAWPNPDAARRPDRFAEPFRVLGEDHAYQRSLCQILVRLAHNPRHAAVTGDIESACDYLARDFALHIADEEDTIMPLLRLRAHAENDVGELGRTLRAGHDADELLAMAILIDLERLASGRSLRDPQGFFGQAVKLSSDLRQHLDWEDRVFLPLAKRRLESADLAQLGREMAARRGMAPQD
ncbi:MAG: hemerythrin domain-containing protein [Alphaproteobacteria bacterium]